MNRQPFTEVEIAQIARTILPQAREEAREEAKAAMNKLCADAFVGGDKSPSDACALHKTMQAKAINRENKWSERFDKVFTTVIGWGVIGVVLFVLNALWASIKDGAHK